MCTGQGAVRTAPESMAHFVQAESGAEGAQSQRSAPIPVTELHGRWEVELRGKRGQSLQCLFKEHGVVCV